MSRACEAHVILQTTDRSVSKCLYFQGTYKTLWNVQRMVLAKYKSQSLVSSLDHINPCCFAACLYWDTWLGGMCKDSVFPIPPPCPKPLVPEHSGEHDLGLCCLKQNCSSVNSWLLKATGVLQQSFTGSVDTMMLVLWARNNGPFLAQRMRWLN